MTLREKFKEFFSFDADAIYSASGRVNLIGEHVDYCGGKVLPASLSLKCRVAVRKNGTNLMRIAATTIDKRAEIDLTKTESYKDLSWGSYQAGVADELKKAGYNLVGCDILYDCKVPFGSGLSSSAAIEVATAYALAKLGGNKIDKVELAVLSQRAENNYCGVNCGIMDQFASANGKKGNAVLLDCATLEYKHIPLDLKNYILVLANCNKPHNLRESKYNERRSEVEFALKVLQDGGLNVKNLAQVKPWELEPFKDNLGEVIYKRAKHVASECLRVEESVKALKSGDIKTFGKLLYQSHDSLKNDYEVTGKELDALVEGAEQQDCCIGSRMTGAGFGGCTVSVVEKDKVDSFIKNVGEYYRNKIGYDASFYVAEIEDGIIDEETKINKYITELVDYAEKYLELSCRDKVYVTNRVMDILGVYDYKKEEYGDIPELPDSILQGIFACLAEQGVEFDSATLGEKLMDAVMLKPSEYERIFAEKYAVSPKTATDWANAYAIHSDYVKKSAIDKNIQFSADNGLEITINLSKPEKNNKDLQKQLKVLSTSYPKCIICRENEGYQKAGFSRRNIRTLSLELAGEDWFMQYSPYAYFNEHCIAISRVHTPMVLDEKTPELLFDFVDKFPHYFIGNNAALPRVGGSILMHNHFQGGCTILPMQKVGYKQLLISEKYPSIKVGVLDWYNTAIRFEGRDRTQISSLVNELVNTWKAYDNKQLDIISSTGEEMHNSASLIARKTEKGYILDVILRNNRISDEYPDGIFHAHKEHHHIKSESIGLIEAMGLFILPARLKRQLGVVCDYLTGKYVYDKDNVTQDMQIFIPMIEKLLAIGNDLSVEKAKDIIKKELTETSQNILIDTAVFKNNDAGQRALKEFLLSIGLKVK
ncbi:MAG: galactokinase [Clostridia bacterium]|nr:galactokinase [Clostridia bacterium]